MTISNIELDTTISCLVIAFLLLKQWVIWWQWPSTSWLGSQVVHGWSYGQPID